MSLKNTAETMLRNGATDAAVLAWLIRAGSPRDSARVRLCLARKAAGVVADGSVKRARDCDKAPEKEDDLIRRNRLFLEALCEERAALAS